MKERDYQKRLIKKLKEMFSGCIILKNDPQYLMGIPDLLILFEDKWAALEVKKSTNSHHQPNQDYYVNKMNKMSFASFIYPENEREVLYALQQTFKPRRKTCRSNSKHTKMGKL